MMGIVSDTQYKISQNSLHFSYYIQVKLIMNRIARKKNQNTLRIKEKRKALLTEKFLFSLSIW